MKQESQSKSRGGVFSRIRGLDIFFSQPVPSFSHGGEQSLTSFTGGFLSICLIAVTSLYTATKFNHLISYKNPQINTHVVEGQFSNEDIFNPRNE